MTLQFFGLIRIYPSISCWGWRTSGEQIPAWWGCLFGAPSQRLSSADSNHHVIPQITPGENSLDPVRICWKVKAHAVYLWVCMFHKHCVWSQGLICKSVPICITLGCPHSCLELPSGPSWCGCYSISFAFTWDINTLTFSDIAYCAAHLLLPFVWIFTSG